MLQMFLRRLAYGFLILNIMTITLFVVVRLIPGDPVRAQLGDAAVSPERIKQITAEFGLDRPVWEQLASWYTGAVRGDFGTSYSLGRPVGEVVFARLPLTIELTFIAVALAVTIGLLMGVVSAVRRNGWLDNVLRVTAVTGLSVPNFWLGLLLITFSSVVLRWVPPLEYRGFFTDPVANLAQMAMPAAALGVVLAASIARLSRSSMLEVLGADFVRTLRAKGAPERVVLFKHALRNSMLPVLTLIGVQLGALLGGTVILEQVFALPGLGRTVFEAVNNRDYPLLQMCVLLYGAIFIVVNIVVDMCYGWVNPRMRRAD
ncbi:MAG: ABC transporter permease subunit [Streptosporangiales bacterium]|nr:ABC transporter permease subunit [Streptosporangiales bacterium]